jgi:DNA-directed RNA polymerase specialized sigma24 family protein
MFETPLSVAAALRRYGEVFDPRTGSVIGVSRGTWDWSGDPFRSGFLGAVEERAELMRRMMSRLQPRERLLLVLWYVSDLQATVIARQLQVSRVHCYRLRDKALRALCDDPQGSRNAEPGGVGEAGAVRRIRRDEGSHVASPLAPQAAG